MQVTGVDNARLKALRVYTEIEERAERGVFLSPNMQGLTDDQIEELKLRNEWVKSVYPGEVQYLNRMTLDDGISVLQMTK